jgi:L-threonylcarbamoyladenylate synthase
MLVLRDPDPASREFGYVRAAVERGEIVAIPTDTVYGLAALAASEEACQRLYECNGRDLNQPTAVVFADLDAVLTVLPTLSDRAGAACEVLLPGPYTLLVANPMNAFPWLCGGNVDSIGIRVPDNALPLPPLAATSANLPGEPEIECIADLPAELADLVACGIDRGPLPPGAASTILDLTAWEWGGDARVLRDPADRAPRALAALAQL